MGALVVVERKRSVYKHSYHFAFCANGCNNKANARGDGTGRRAGTHVIQIMGRNPSPDGLPVFLCRNCATEAESIWEGALERTDTQVSTPA